MYANDNRKVAIVGVGMVGMSCAYSIINQSICDELVLIDIDKNRAHGEALDLSHGLPFAPSNIKIYDGDYNDCNDADIVVLCAGAPQLEGETRRDLLQKNYSVFQGIIPPIVSSGFRGVFLVATNPVDVMTQVAYKLSGFPSGRVVGTGTTLDSARLRSMMSDYFRVNPRNVHAYVLGEHGDSEFVAWSSAYISVKPLSYFENSNTHLKSDMLELEKRVRLSAYEIIKAKRATYYGIGMVLSRLVKAILNDENSVFTVSTYLKGEYGYNGVYIGVPAIVNKFGVREVLEIDFSGEEREHFQNSVEVIENMKNEIGIS